MVKHAVGSLSAKPMGEQQKPIVFTDVGLFHTNLSRDAYVHHYLVFSDNHVLDQHLMESQISVTFTGY